MEHTLKTLLEQAGPRGATFMGRHIPQGQSPTLSQLLSRPANEPVEGEGMGGMMGIAGAGVFGANMPKRVGRAMTDVEKLRLYLAAVKHQELQPLVRKAKGIEQFRLMEQLDDLAEEIQRLQSR